MSESIDFTNPQTEVNILNHSISKKNNLGRKLGMIRCDVCGKPIYRAHMIITGSTLEAWCHTCFKEFNPEVSRIFDPENETWEISDGPSETAL